MKLFIAAIFILTSTLYGESRITPDNLKGGKLFKGSESTQRIGLYCINCGLTTMTRMVLMSKAQDKILASIPVRSTNSIDKHHKNWLTVKWNTQGNLVAIHDALDKHSKVLIYRRVVDGTFKAVELPDMLKVEGASRLGLDVSSIVSSGQEPDTWRNKNLLMVKYRFRTKNGKLYRRTLPIFIDDAGNYQQQ